MRKRAVKGNPLNPNGHKTAYLWSEVWQRDSLLEIIGRYIVPERDAKKQISRTVFPRYHQLDATRKLRAAILAEGVGGKYLIQHSAGSGKTNSIAWSAHFLADLHDAQNQKVFDTVLVVSDRNVIDTQLQEAIFNFERTKGVVATINSDAGAKSGQLAEALAGGKKIVVCTIQTFPFALQAVQELSASKGKHFAVIADEAHSSQTGEAAAKLKQLLSPGELAELADGGEISSEDILAAQMAAKAGLKGITFVAFTATPKAKTLELFGRLPDPSLPASATNLPAAFHVYSMRQAIEEGFILDVLRLRLIGRAGGLPRCLTGSGENAEHYERESIVRNFMRSLNKYSFAAALLVVAACQVTPPVVEKATTNLIAISYDAYGSTPTITPEALDLAIEHCKKQGLFANYRGANIPNQLTAKEVHTFVCERTKTDDNAVIIAQNQQHATASNTVDAFLDGYKQAQPTYTHCSTIGFQTNCSSY